MTANSLCYRCRNSGYREFLGKVYCWDCWLDFEEEMQDTDLLCERDDDWPFHAEEEDWGA